MDKIGKRKIILMLAAVLLFCQLALPVRAEGELSLASQAAILIDAETGQILYGKNVREQLYPASITKIMTALLAIRNLDLQQQLTVSQSAVDAVPRTSSHISLKPGEVITVEQALYSIGMESANDAANVLAEAVSGSLTEFAELMTRTAAELGAENTRFANANGLPDRNHYTTAYDMALITAAALKEPGLADYFSTVEYILSPTNLSDARPFANKDRLLPGGQYYYEGVLMAKTGWTTSAQGTFAAAVKRGDTTLVAVTLKSPLLEDKYRDTWALMDYGFSQYSQIHVTGEMLAEKLQLGDYVPVSGQSFHYQLDKGIDPSEITYQLAAGTELQEDQTAVTVMVSFGEIALPSGTLLLERVLPEPTIEPEIIEVVEKTAVGGLFFLLVGGGILFLFTAYRRYRKIRLRRRRRDELNARIRQMKRRMGKTRK